MSHSSCRCPECFGLAEFMLSETGKDYGLPASPGHSLPELVVPEPAPVIQLRPRTVRQPWDVRPARAA